VVDPAEGGVHRAPEGGADPDAADAGGDPDRGRALTNAFDRVGEGVLLDVGKESLQVDDDALLDLVAVDDLPEDEQHEQREREDRQHQVVGDHPGQAGDVLLVRAVPKAACPGGSPRRAALGCLEL
jgi:hypothetical protein